MHFWKSIPFVRILLPLIAGILLQWKLAVGILPLTIGFVLIILLLLIVNFLPNVWQYQLQTFQGFNTIICCCIAGMLLASVHKMDNQPNWIGNYPLTQTAVLVTVEEPLVEKAKTYKAVASTKAIFINHQWKNVSGKIILYFKKDSLPLKIAYGNQLLLYKALQPITNGGNPGSFDYKKYAAFQHISHQIFLTKKDYQVLTTHQTNPFKSFIYKTKFIILRILRSNIQNKKELSIAEALLIGYRDDLDKNVVQAYSNTGVVHIIAISGLHLGMIYGLLLLCFNYFKKGDRLPIWSAFIIILILWLFAFVSGAAASILRSALMFTCMVIGNTLKRKTNTYNTLAASAFLLLCFNPYLLWDVGFQLSYGAVLGIITFMQPIYQLLYTQNKLLDKIWKLNAVTLSAQVFTIPIMLYHFHQFPNLFLIANFVAVPLSGCILYAEIFLVCLSTIGITTSWLGKLIEQSIYLLNAFIERINQIPFSVTDEIWINLPLSLLLLAFMSMLGLFFIHKKKWQIWFALLLLPIFTSWRLLEKIKHQQQKLMVVYNVPNYTAIDIIQGNSVCFIGDDELTKDDFLRNFHLKPSRIQLQATSIKKYLPIAAINPVIISNGKRLLILNHPLTNLPTKGFTSFDYIVLTKNPKIYLKQVSQFLKAKVWIADASNPNWKIAYWKKDAEILHLQLHSVSDSGAFVSSL